MNLDILVYNEHLLLTNGNNNSNTFKTIYNVSVSISYQTYTSFIDFKRN